MENLIGQKFNILTVKERLENDKFGRSRWLCLCGCGNNKIIRGDNLKNGNTTSCGCLKGNLKHGKAKIGKVSKTYNIWKNMIRRCNNPKDPAYKHYGGRGISVCDRWLKFENFYEDIGEPPNGLTFDRTDNDGNYSPNNWRWATWEEQANNKRNNINK